MLNAVKEKVIVDPINKGFNVVTRLGGAVDEGIATAKRVGKHTTDAIEDLMDDTTLRIKRHPTEAVVGAFAAGIIVGGIAGAFLFWTLNRK